MHRINRISKAISVSFSGHQFKAAAELKLNRISRNNEMCAADSE